MLPRGLSADRLAADKAFTKRVDALYGTRDWERFYEAELAGKLFPAEFRDELVNLMRWRLQNVLGYARTHAFELKNTNGNPIYTMIFATDNLAGDRIMASIYGKAAALRPQMQAEAAACAQARRDEERGTPGLFDPMPRDTPPDRLYQHEPPWGPEGIPG